MAEEAASTEQPLEKVSEPQPESGEAAATSIHQTVSMDKDSEHKQVESEESTTPASEKVGEPQQHESEEALQPASVEKASEPHQAKTDREIASTHQEASVEKASEPQEPESGESTSMVTPTQQPEPSERVNESGQTESGEGVGSQGGRVTACEHEPTNVRVAPEVENCPFCRIVAELSRANEVYRDNDFVCFEDRNPVSALHYLLVPRKHYQDLRLVLSRSLIQV